VSKPYQNFLDILDSREPQTKEKYVKYFDYYLKFIKVKNSNSLIIRRYPSPQEIAKIEDRIISYITYLKKQKLNQSTIKGRVYSIFKFYTSNRVNLDRKHISQYFPAPGKTMEDQPYTTEDIQEMLKATTNPERDKFMLYLLASTGMRIGALTDLKYGDIEQMEPMGYPPNKHVYKVIVYRGTRQEYYTFTSFEAAEALDNYTGYRRRFGEQITKDSPLLRDQLNSTYRTKMKDRANFIKSFSDVVDRIANRAGIRARGHDRQVRHIKALDHAFRKFANTQMIEAGVDFDTKEFLLGHKTTRGLDISYSRIPVHKRLAEYVKAMDLLTINDENRLRKQVAEQEYTIQHKLVEKDKQIEEMTRKQEQFEILIQSLIDSGQLKPIGKT
jgi:integrase